METPRNTSTRPSSCRASSRLCAETCTVGRPSPEDGAHTMKRVAVGRGRPSHQKSLRRPPLPHKQKLATQCGLDPGAPELQGAGVPASALTPTVPRQPRSSTNAASPQPGPKVACRCEHCMGADTIPCIDAQAFGTVMGKLTLGVSRGVALCRAATPGVVYGRSGVRSSGIRPEIDRPRFDVGRGAGSRRPDPIRRIAPGPLKSAPKPEYRGEKRNTLQWHESPRLGRNWADVGRCRPMSASFTEFFTMSKVNPASIAAHCRPKSQ